MINSDISQRIREEIVVSQNFIGFYINEMMLHFEELCTSIKAPLNYHSFSSPLNYHIV